MVPYVDPKTFNRRKNNNNQTTQIYSLNEKSDVYSVGILLWEISSGQPSFYGENYDVGLILEISQGHRKTVVPDTPEEYVKIYTKCWDGHVPVPVTTPPLSINNSYSQGDLSRLIQQFNEMNTNDINNIIGSEKQEKLSYEKDFNRIIDEINEMIIKLKNKELNGNQ
ncbi:uncharacterized protein OCT59_002145 [Rhizophagus irregularis]|uniref:Protein kinase domain-containing protein n=1 Tax=Rhizophagus irregularis (strain DAOM 197198w) TaxID=1432141 RepID=A0A015J6C7_RHIIW|nr:hypothetical protein RirG_136740 [Rhizophagus irregularis DAOM 197198w]UZO10565.1 hypothetical protein OCT59_002145 [Rhizophagus irregularis]GBC47222.2 kinase-like domain-containing protein [Rhizophagus irregularis DAOM 181602=DAOM 197198]